MLDKSVVNLILVKHKVFEFEFRLDVADDSWYFLAVMHIWCT